MFLIAIYPQYFDDRNYGFDVEVLDAESNVYIGDHHPESRYVYFNFRFFCFLMIALLTS
jgi:hypothetical protein